MLEAEVLDAIAEREEEVIGLVVTRAEHRVGFLCEAFPFLREIRRHVKRGGTVGDQIHFDRPARRVERHGASLRSPAITGESTSVVSETGAKSIVPPPWPATVSEVPNFQFSGSRRLARNITSSVRAPIGYSSTWFHE